MLNHKKNLELVKEFQNLFDEEIASINDIKAHESRWALIKEEGITEWASATTNIERLDSICDLVYVCYGSFVKFGFNPFISMPRGFNSKNRRIRNKVRTKNIDLYLKYLNTKKYLKYLHEGCNRAKIFGFNNIIQQAFEEVHRSNMSKACKTLDEVQATIAQPKYGNVKIDYTLKNGVYLLHFAEDWQEMGIKKGKVVKSINYSPANLEQFV